MPRIKPARQYLSTVWIDSPEKFAAVQRDELDQKREALDLAAQPLYQIHRGARRAAGGQQIVDDEHPLPLRTASS